jgi:hypothetical protein
MGSSFWMMPRHQPPKVDYVCDNTVGDVAVVMIFLFVHVDGEERAAGGTLLVAAPWNQ